MKQETPGSDGWSAWQTCTASIESFFSWSFLAGITFDIFLAHSHIPFGAYVSSESCEESEAEIELEVEAV